jgi:hypothetical protein
MKAFFAPASGLLNVALRFKLNRSDLADHGFRSKFRGWAAQRTRSPHEVVEAALAHMIGDPPRPLYRQGDFFDKRRRQKGPLPRAKPVPGRGSVATLHGSRIGDIHRSPPGGERR